MFGVKLGLATLAAFVALVAAVSAHASTPIPWCGTSSSAVDRLPDATSAYAVHVAYVRPASAPDRFLEFAPRIVGDAAAFDAWWRRQDPTRTPRFDLFPAPGCATSFGALDISNVQLSRGVSRHRQRLPGAPAADARSSASTRRRRPTSSTTTARPARSALDHVCGQGARTSGFDLPGLAVVYLDSCDADEGDSLRPGGGHARARARLRRGRAGGAELLPERARLRLRTRPDDRRPHRRGARGARPRLRPQRLLRPQRHLDRRAGLDLPRAARLARPHAAGRCRTASVSATHLTGFVRVSWQPSTDDVGPVAYRIYEDGRFVRQVTTTTVRLPDTHDLTHVFAIRAADGSAASARPSARGSGRGPAWSTSRAG